MTTYLIELSLYWAAFWGFYMLMLRQEKFFRLNRIYLLATFVLALVLPAVNWSGFFPGPDWLATPIVWLQTIVVSPDTLPVNAGNASAGGSLSLLFWGLYSTGCAFALYRFVAGLLQLKKRIKAGKLQKEGAICWVYSDVEHLPYSWLNFLFWSNALNLSSQEQESIIAHEKAHIQQKHSWDILLLELSGLLMWWHPLWYAYRHAITNVHEYLADEAALKDTATRDYGRLLLRQSFQQTPLPFIQTFQTSQLKKRIIMMTKSPSSYLALAKYLLFLPMTLLLLFACEDAEAQKEIKESVADALEEPSYFERIDTVTTFDPNTKTESVAVVKTKVYEKVEQMPIFGNCDNLSGKEQMNCSSKNLLTFVYERVKYPKEAASAGQEGLAVTKFVVDVNGKVTDVQLIEEKTTEHQALNEVALSVVRSLPNFQPGMQDGKAVNVEMVLPIKFKLE